MYNHIYYVVVLGMLAEGAARTASPPAPALGGASAKKDNPKVCSMYVFI